jgi:hypothetical protein
MKSENVFVPFRGNYQALSEAVAGWMFLQWRWLMTPYRLGLRYARSPQVPPGAKAPDASLEARVLERTGQGLAPPREIYDVANRNRIDWSRVPEWARPSDPELFEGCPHEG